MNSKPHICVEKTAWGSLAKGVGHWMKCQEGWGSDVHMQREENPSKSTHVKYMTCAVVAVGWGDE